MESAGFLDDLRNDIAKKFKNGRIARILTARRLLRYSVGHFMYFENGAAV